MKKIDSLLVKGFSGYRITKALPWHSAVGMIIFVVILIISHYLFYLYGVYQAAPTLEKTEEKVAKSIKEIKIKEKELEKAYIKSSKLVESNEVLSIQNKNLAELVNKLESDFNRVMPELNYLRSLTTEENLEYGLNIQGLKVTKNMDSYNNTRYDYQFFIRQVKDSKGVTQGKMILVVSGKQKNKDKSIVVSNQKFQLKYFSKIDGFMQFPVSFQPQKITITLNPNSEKYKPKTAVFQWDALNS